MWISGGFTRPTIEEFAIASAAAQGYCSALTELLDITFDQLIEVDHE
jgi:hypothetical protein